MSRIKLFVKRFFYNIVHITSFPPIFFDYSHWYHLLYITTNEHVFKCTNYISQNQFLEAWREFTKFGAIDLSL